MKVIYTVGALPDWVEIAKKLKTSYGWEPCFWLLVKNESQVLKEFPDVMHHWFHLINRGIQTDFLSHNGYTPISLDADIIEQFSKYEHSTLALMDRMDFGHTFSFQERQRLYYRLLCYWLNVFNIVKPDISIFNISPHSVAEYTLYAVSVEMGCRIAILQTTSIPYLIYVKNNINGQPQRLIDAYKNSIDKIKMKKGKEEDGLSADLHNYLNKMKLSYSVAKPWFMISDNGNKEPIRRRLQRTINRLAIWTYKKLSNLMNAVSGRMREDIFVFRSDDIMDRKNNLSKVVKRFIHSTRRRYQTLRLKSDYSKRCAADIDFNVPYIYVPLHFQPERTTLPEGRYYYDQFLMVSLISKCIPANWYLYVKEHKSQFCHFEGSNVRMPSTYDDIQSCTNVVFLSTDTPTFDLIDNCQAVATVTGTAGWEGICRGKPALVFGTAWYSGCKGAFTAESADACKKAIEQIQKGYHIDEDDVRAFLIALEKIGARGYLTKSYKRGVGSEINENVNSLTKALWEHINEI